MNIFVEANMSSAEWELMGLDNWDETKCIEELESRDWHLKTFLKRVGVNQPDIDEVGLMRGTIRQAIKLNSQNPDPQRLRELLKEINRDFLKILDRK